VYAWIVATIGADLKRPGLWLPDRRMLMLVAAAGQIKHLWALPAISP
jgi:hypothetical protein